MEVIDSRMSQPAGPRKPADARLGAVRLQVGDLSRSVAYYRGLLGLRLLREGDGRAVLGAPGDDAPLVELVERPGAAPAPPRGRLGLFHFAILLPDRASLGHFLAHLSARGIRAGTADHLVSEAVYLADPDGLGIEVYADRPRHSWGRRGTELAIDTLPLDVAAVIAEGGDDLWAGMPAGTTMGHVHLHVGDLERAAAFYHEGLGLDVTVRSYPGALFLSAGGYHHHLGLNTWARPGAATPGPDEAQLLEWELVLPGGGDVNDAAGRLQSAGAPVRGVDGSVLVQDPWGTTLRLSSAAR